MSACPSLNFSCSNISCSIWFCCGGGSNKEHEREQQNQKQRAAVPNNSPQPSPPPPPQVIKVPGHLREPSTIEKPAAPQPPAPLPSYSYTPAIAETGPHPRREPPTHTYYPPRTQPPPPPSTTQQQATRPATLQTPTLPAAPPPPKVYDSWTQTTLHAHPVPVWPSRTQTPSSAPILPPSLASPPNKVLDDMRRPHMPMIPASDAQSEMVHSKPPPPQPPRPARQPSKTYQTMPQTVDQLHPAYSRLPSENYYYDEAALPDVVPPRAALPLGDSQHYVGFYAQERWE